MARHENTPIKDIMVWGGTHGSPPKGEGGSGVPLVRSLQKSPVRTAGGRIEAGIANPEAVRLGERYIEKNLVFCIAQPEKFRNTYEGQLVPGILQRSKNRDLVVDMHHQQISSNVDYMCVGSRVYPYTFGFAALAAINTIMVAENGLYRHFPQAALVDLFKKSERDNVGYWRSILSRTLEEGLPSPSIEKFTIYAHTNLTDSEQDQLGITNQQFSPFEEVPGAGELLGVNRKVYALSTDGIEVVAEVRPQDIAVAGDIIHLPALRSLGGKTE